MLTDDELKAKIFHRLAYCGPIGYDMPAEDKEAIKWAALKLTEAELKQKEVERLRGIAGRELLHATNDYDNGWNDACTRIQYAIDAALKETTKEARDVD